jgi:hypothetical protein
VLKVGRSAQLRGLLGCNLALTFDEPSSRNFKHPSFFSERRARGRARRQEPELRAIETQTSFLSASRFPPRWQCPGRSDRASAIAERDREHPAERAVVRQARPRSREVASRRPEAAAPRRWIVLPNPGRSGWRVGKSVRDRRRPRPFDAERHTPRRHWRSSEARPKNASSARLSLSRARTAEVTHRRSHHRRAAGTRGRPDARRPGAQHRWPASRWACRADTARRRTPTASCTRSRPCTCADAARSRSPRAA